MKNIIRALFCFGIVLAAPEIYSQQPVKLGHVNLADIVTALPESDSAKKTLEKETKDLQNTIENMQTEYNKMIEDFGNNQATYTESEKQNKRNEIAQLQSKIAGFQQNAQQQLQQRNTELIQPILQKVHQAIDKVSAREGFTYVFDISQGIVVFNSQDSYDLNSLVLTELGIKK
jgi:outer membrane protein